MKNHPHSLIHEEDEQQEVNERLLSLFSCPHPHDEPRAFATCILTKRKKTIQVKNIPFYMP